MSDYRKLEYATWLCVHKRMTALGRGRAYSASVERLVRWVGVLVASALMLACEGYRQPTRFVSTVDPELLTLCNLASDRWYEATGIAVECLYGESDYHTPMRWGVPGDCAYGNTNDERIMVRHDARAECNEKVPAPDPEATRLAVVTHELGHAIAGWRDHTHAASGVMGRVTYRGAPIDQASIDWLCETADCVWEEAE